MLRPACGLRHSGAVLTFLSRVVLVPLVRLLWRPRVVGRRNVPRRGAVILASNHLSFMDSVVITLMAPREVSFLAKNAYFTGTGLKGRLSRSFFSGIGAIGVERGAGAAAQQALDLGLVARGRPRDEGSDDPGHERGDRTEGPQLVEPVDRVRELALRPRGGGHSRRLPLDHGDLLVMGGSCQRTWDHAVPKVTTPVGPRMSIQFRVRGVRCSGWGPWRQPTS